MPNPYTHEDESDSNLCPRLKDNILFLKFIVDQTNSHKWMWRLGEYISIM